MNHIHLTDKELNSVIFAVCKQVGKYKYRNGVLYNGGRRGGANRLDEFLLLLENILKQTEETHETE
jgi:hypothetical protein